MGATGLHGYTGYTGAGYVQDGIIQSSAPSSDSGGVAVSSSSSATSNLGVSLSNILNRSDNALGEAMRQASDVASSNSALSQSFAREMMDYQTDSNQYAMDWSAAQAKATRDWQEEMSNTSHQREVKDLMAAGLNPILSANQGATTPTGSTGQAYTSSGAQGSVDTSTIASIMNTAMNSATTLKSMDISQEMQREKLAAELTMNHVSSDAMMSAAGTNAAASIYGSDKAFEAAIQGQKNQYAMSALDRQLERWSTDLKNATERYKSDQSLYGTLNAPGTIYKDFNSFLNGLKSAWNDTSWSKDLNAAMSKAFSANAGGAFE